MRFTMKIAFTTLLCLLSLGHSQSIDFKGTVKDRHTQKLLDGVIVRLVANRMTDTTDSQGRFQFLVTPTDLGRQTVEAEWTDPRFRTDRGIRFQVTKWGRVELDLYNLQGQLQRRVMDKWLERGSWVIPTEALPGGIHLARLRIGGRSRTLRIFNLGEGRGDVSIRKVDASSEAGPNAMAKAAAPYADTLVLSKAGYQEAVIGVASVQKDSVTILLHDNSAEDGVNPGVWDLTLSYGRISLIVGKTGKDILGVTYNFNPPCSGAPGAWNFGPSLISKDGSATGSDSLDIHFSDSLVVGNVKTPSPVQSCSNVHMHGESCTYYGSVPICQVTYDYNLPYIGSTLPTKGSWTGPAKKEAGLSSLYFTYDTLTSGYSNATDTLNAPVNPDTNRYELIAGYKANRVRMVARASDSSATLEFNGKKYSGLLKSDNLDLAVGENSFQIKVVGQDLETFRTYTIKVIRRPRNDASLASLSLSQGTLSPLFRKDSLGYNASVPGAMDSLKITAIGSDSAASIRINGIPVASGQASPSLHLDVGFNSFLVKVTAQDTVFKRSYAILVFRPSTVADLSSLILSQGATLSPTFSSDSIAYSATVANDVASITATAVPKDSNAVFTVNNYSTAPGAASLPVSLSVGVNTIKVAVTAQDKSIHKTYTVTVYRRGSPNANLKTLGLNAGTLKPAFDSLVTDYSLDFQYANSVTLTPVASSAQAGIKVNGVGPNYWGEFTVPVGYGTTLATITVTAQDSSRKTYVVRVHVPVSLSALSISSGKLVPNFTGSTYSYRDTVPFFLDSLTVTPTATSTGTITVNGVLVPSGSPSMSIGLGSDSTSITVRTLSPDTSIALEYHVTVFRDHAKWRAITAGDSYVNYIGFLPRSATLFSMSSWNTSGSFAKVILSRNGGSSWTTLKSPDASDFKASLFKTPVIFADSAGDSAYAIDWRGYPYLSTSAGSSWQPITFPGGNLGVQGFAVDPNASHRVHAVRNGVLLRSPDKGSSWVTLVDSVNVLDMAFHPVDTNIQFVAAAAKSTISGGILKSLDGGATWARELASTDLNCISIAPSRPGVVYAAGNGGGIYKSVDGSAWVQVNAGLPSLDVRAVAVSPASPDIVYAAVYGSGVYMSLDGGATWAPLAGIGNLNVTTLAVDPVNGGIVYAGTFGGGLFKWW